MNTVRALPSIDRLLREPQAGLLVARYSRGRVLEGARELLGELRRRALQDDGHAIPPLSELVEELARRLEQAVRPPLRRAINATGVVVHTNLGRAPLSPAAMAAIELVGRGYSNLEYDLEAGQRGSRHEHVTGALKRLTGAEAALVVNNNAAAMLLVLSALAVGREVVISRGQLVEIGGGFRIPDVLRESGARLVEVGSTNRTYVADYAAAVGPETAMLLRVHSSNFRVLGFVHETSLRELAELARARGLVLADDLGSGALVDTSAFGLDREPMVQESIAEGADLVCFSGDKLLGGPQCGVIVGRADLLGRLKRHPLTRAVRPDKLTLAALGATLEHYLRGEATEQVPVLRMLAAPAAEIATRARALAGRLGGRGFDLLDGASTVGGGSLPGATLPTHLLALPGGSPDRLAARLRQLDPPVIGRVEQDRLVLDLRTVLPEEDDLLATTLAVGLREGGLADPSIHPPEVGDALPAAAGRVGEGG